MIIVERPRFSLRRPVPAHAHCLLPASASSRQLRAPASSLLLCNGSQRAPTPLHRQRPACSRQCVPCCSVFGCDCVLGLEEGRHYGTAPWPARPPTVPPSRAVPPAMQHAFYPTPPYTHGTCGAYDMSLHALPPAVHLAPAYPFPACPCLLPGPGLAPAIPSGPSGPSRFGLLSQQRFLLKRPPPPFSFPGGVLW